MIRNVRRADLSFAEEQFCERVNYMDQVGEKYLRGQGNLLTRLNKSYTTLRFVQLYIPFSALYTLSTRHVTQMLFSVLISTVRQTTRGFTQGIPETSDATKLHKISNGDDDRAVPHLMFL